MKSKLLTRVFSLVVSLLMLFALVPTAAFAAEGGISPNSIIGTTLGHYDAATNTRLPNNYEVFSRSLVLQDDQDLVGEYTPVIPGTEYVDSETNTKYTLAKLIIDARTNPATDTEHYYEITNFVNPEPVTIPANAIAVGLNYMWNVEQLGEVDPDPDPDPDPDEDPDAPIVNWIASLDRSVVQNSETLSASAGVTPDTYVLRAANKQGITVTYDATMDMENLSSYFGGQSWAVLNQRAYGIDDSTTVNLHFVFDENIDVTSFNDERFAAASLTSDMFQMDSYQINEANNELILICHWNTESVIEQRNAYWAEHGGSVGQDVIYSNDFAFLDNMITLKNVQLDVKSDWEGESVQLTNNGYVDGYMNLRMYSDYATFPDITNDNFDPNDGSYVTATGGPIDGGEEEDTFVLTTNDKTSLPGMDKTIVLEDGTEVDKDNVAAGDTVKFQLESNVPENLEDYVDYTPDDPVIVPNSIGDAGTYTLVFHDEMAKELALNEDSIQVMLGDEEIADEYVTIDYDPTDDCTFEVSVDLAAMYNADVIDEDDFGVTPITVNYTATLNADEVAGAYTNTAWVVYPDGSSEPDTVTVYTYGIDIFKYDQGKGLDAADAGLDGAEFALYGAEDVTVADDGTVTVNGDAEAIETVASANGGHATIGGLDEGTYYLVETKAPDGYVKSDTPLKIVIPEDADGTTYMVDVNFANTLIPHTGGMGTTMFTLGGAAILAAAGVLFIYSRKTRKDQEEN